MPARSLVLLACAAVASPASAGTLTPASGGFALTHAGEVDSGLISVLGTFTSTQTSAAPTLRFPMFDPSVGRLTGVAVSVNTSTSTFAITPSGVLSLISFASASRSLNYTVTAGATTATDGVTRSDSGGTLLTLLGLGGAEIGGAQVARSTTFNAASDLASFVGAGSVNVDIAATDTLTVSTLLSLLNGAGFSGSGQCAGTVSLTYTYSPYPSNGQVSIAKVASTTAAKSGDTITYTLVFTNNGNNPVAALAIHDETPAWTTYQGARPMTLPAGMTAATVSAPVPGSAGGLAWTFTGPLAAAASGTLQYTVVVN